MATADVLPTYEQTLAALQVEHWGENSAAENQINSDLEKLIEAVEKPLNIERIKSIIKDVATKTVKIDQTFHDVTNVLAVFVRDHGKKFPELKGYHDDWEGYRTEWQTRLSESRTLAKDAAVSYTELDMTLEEFVDTIKTEEDVRDAAAALKHYSEETPPVGITDDLSKAFEELRKDIIAYQKNMSDYLKKKITDMPGDIQKLKDKLESLQGELSDLEKDVKKYTLALSIAAWWGPIGAIVTGTLLGIAVKKRNEKQSEVNSKQAEYDTASAQLAGLKEIQTRFESLEVSINTITDSLGELSTVWHWCHLEAGAFAKYLKALTDPTMIARQFVLRVKLARKSSVPLSEALTLYAEVIKVHQGL